MSREWRSMDGPLRKDILVSGDQITVRGEAAGTPERELFGAKPTGKNFKTMSID